MLPRLGGSGENNWQAEPPGETAYPTNPNTNFGQDQGSMSATPQS